MKVKGAVREAAWSEMVAEAVDALLVWAAHDEAERDTCAQEALDHLRPIARRLLAKQRWLKRLGTDAVAAMFADEEE